MARKRLPLREFDDLIGLEFVLDGGVDLDQDPVMILIAANFPATFIENMQKGLVSYPTLTLKSQYYDDCSSLCKPIMLPQANSWAVITLGSGGPPMVATGFNQTGFEGRRVGLYMA